MERSENILAHRVVLDGKVYPMSVVSIRGKSVSVAPFERECHSTSFYSGTVEVRTATGDWWHSPEDGEPVPVYKKNE